MESYIKMHKIFKMEAMMDHLIGAPKKTIIIMLGKPQMILKTKSYILLKAIFLVYIKGNFVCSFTRDG